MALAKLDGYDEMNGGDQRLGFVHGKGISLRPISFVKTRTPKVQGRFSWTGRSPYPNSNARFRKLTVLLYVSVSLSMAVFDEYQTTP
jgi:hypothetical protein